jgi:hypothetical protein
VSAFFLRGYLEAIQGAPFVPTDRRSFVVLLDALVLERALYQLSKQLDLPALAEGPAIPLLGLVDFLAARRK